MKIPKNIIHRNRRYELVKAYPNFILYKDKKTGVRETFQRYDLGMIQETVKDVSGYHKKNIW